MRAPRSPSRPRGFSLPDREDRMTPSRHSRESGLRAIRLLPWAAGAALLAFAAGAHLGRPAAVDAFGGQFEGDTDHDGISDALEAIIGLNPDNADSDRDSWMDSEEMARASVIATGTARRLTCT